MENEEEKIDIDFEMGNENPPQTDIIENNLPDLALADQETDLALAEEQAEPTILNTIGDMVEESIAAITGTEGEGEAVAPAVVPEQVVPEQVAPSTKPKTRKKNLLKNSTRTRKARKEKIHASAKTADEWVRYKINDPTLYSVSPEGDYYTDPLLKSGERQTTATIQPKVYYQADQKQLKERYAERDAKVAEAEDAYSNARKELMEIMNSYRAGVALTSEVVLANMKVADAEKVRNKYAYHTYGPYFVDPRPALVDLQFDIHYVAPEKRNPYNVVRYGINRFPWEFHYSDTLPPVEIIPVEQPAGQEVQAEPTRELSQAQIGAIIGKKRALTRPPMPKF